MKDLILQIGGSVVRSPYGVEVTWKKSLFTEEGEKTTRFFLTEKEQDECIKRVKRSDKCKNVRKVRG